MRYHFLPLMIFIWGTVTQISHAQINPAGLPAPLINKSVKEVLGSDQEIKWQPYRISDPAKDSLSGHFKVKKSLPDSLYIGTASIQSKTVYLIPDRARSKSEWFTYILYVNEDGSIRDVDVMQYRENYGYQIDYPMFRRQFKGKTSPGKIIFGRTIHNISGATISAWSLTYSVHDLLTLFDYLKKTKQLP